MSNKKIKVQLLQKKAHSVAIMDLISGHKFHFIPNLRYIGFFNGIPMLNLSCQNSDIKG